MSSTQEYAWSRSEVSRVAALMTEALHAWRSYPASYDFYELCCHLHEQGFRAKDIDEDILQAILPKALVPNAPYRVHRRLPWPWGAIYDQCTENLHARWGESSR